MIKIGNYVVKRTISWLRAILQFCMSISVRQPQQSWSQIAKKKKKKKMLMKMPVGRVNHIRNSSVKLRRWQFLLPWGSQKSLSRGMRFTLGCPSNNWTYCPQLGLQVFNIWKFPFTGPCTKQRTSKTTGHQEYLLHHNFITNFQK